MSIVSIVIFIVAVGVVVYNYATDFDPLVAGFIILFGMIASVIWAFYGDDIPVALLTTAIAIPAAGAFSFFLCVLTDA